MTDRLEALVLAAGTGSRFGGGKNCEPLEVMRDTADISVPASSIEVSARIPGNRLNRTAE